MIDLPSNKLANARLHNKLATLVVVVTFFISLGIISAKTTESVNVGFYHHGEYHLNIRNKKGEPIEGAVLNVFEKNTKNFAFYFPIDNYRIENGLTSNKEGSIIAVHIPFGIEKGRVCRKLFWLYSICSAYTPGFDLEVSADGYQSIKFSADTLFYNPAYNSQSNGHINLPHPDIKDVWVETPIYHLTFTLEKQE